MEAGANRSWKLGVQESKDSEIEEVILHVQGIMCNRKLPPIRRPFKVYAPTFQLEQTKYRWFYNRQPNKFNDSILSVCVIEDLFRWQGADRNMEDWVPSTFQGHPSIDVGNRYFTPSQHALQDRQILFSLAVDLTTYFLRQWEMSLSIQKITRLNTMKPVKRENQVGDKIPWQSNKNDNNFVDTMISIPVPYISAISWKCKFLLKAYSWGQ